jgi:uncharacterized protein (TIGR02246 family)
VLAALCLGAAEEKTAIKTGAPAAAKATSKTADKPITSPSETVGTKSNSKPASQEPTPASPTSDKRSSDEEALRLTGESFAKAYDAGDAKTIAAHFTPDAEYIDEQGNVYQGRAAIEEAMTVCFAEHPGCQIEFDIETIRFISPGVAVEDGATTITHSDGMESISSRYTAVHVKADGKWLVASIRDHVPKERRQHRSQLEQLGWLKGEWVDEGDDSVVIFSCESVDNGNFLLRKFTIQIDGHESLSGTQRIGWDPLLGKLRAWIFDSEGGYSEGVWHRDEDHWVLKSTGVTADGETASGTSIYTFIDENTMTWQLVDHEVAGVQHDDSDVVTIVRRAPSPGTADETPLTKSN